MSALSDPLLIVRQRRAFDESLQWRFAVAVLAGVRTFSVVPLHRYINVGLKFFEPVIQLTPKRARVELALNGLLETLANTVGLQTPGLRSGVLDVVQIENN